MKPENIKLQLKEIYNFTADHIQAQIQILKLGEIEKITKPLKQKSSKSCFFFSGKAYYFHSK